MSLPAKAFLKLLSTLLRPPDTPVFSFIRPEANILLYCSLVILTTFFFDSLSALAIDFFSNTISGSIVAIAFLIRGILYSLTVPTILPVAS